LTDQIISEESEMTNEDSDCAVVRRNLEAVQRHDLDAIAATLAPGVIQHYQRPTGRRDDGTLLASSLVGRDKIIEEIRDNFYVTLYKPGTARIDIERMISGGGWVAVQFSLTAITLSKGEEYKNYYFFLYQIENNQIIEYWEYVDTAYANEKLYSTVSK
jgi:ketosteroid isomerase-like protein